MSTTTTSHASGSSSDYTSPKRHTGIYTGHQAPSDMQKALADSIRDMSHVRIRNSAFVGIMVDESLDIAVNKKLVMFAKIVYGGQLKIEYCANVEIKDGKAETVYSAIVNWRTSVGVSIKRVSGFGSDGASVMTGKVSGVGVRLQRNNPRIIHVWCAAHRLALVCYWAAKHVPYLARMQEILIAIYNCFEYSAPRYNKIREMKKIMGEKVKKFKKPTQVRWLSLQNSVDAVHDSCSALILSLDHEAATNNGEGGAKAKGILKEIKTFKFISTLCLLKDVLGILCRVSKVFQKDVIDVDQVDSMVNSTKATLSAFERIDPPHVEELIESVDEYGEYKGVNVDYSLRRRLEFTAVKRLFVQHIVRELCERFPENDLLALKDLNKILNPKMLPAGANDLREHGVESLERIVEKYQGGEDNLIERERAFGQYIHFKFFLNSKRHMSVTDLCLLISDSCIEQFPDFHVMANIFLTVPMTSVPCERGFSLQNQHINKSTNRRSVSSVSNRMTIAFYRNKDDFDEVSVIQRAAQKFV
ncbi:zinc finger protein 862-like [Argopecten irradians]|uniref:zinc finger protein 862-like n=1 Tax=Argopecten irradians TaxID=31199 RepID=UPI00371CEBBC